MRNPTMGVGVTSRRGFSHDAGATRAWEIGYASTTRAWEIGYVPALPAWEIGFASDRESQV